MRGPRGGFTLVELLVGLSVLLLALGLGFAVMRGARTRTSVRQVAMQLVADLRWARSCAVASGKPSMLLFPPDATAAAYHVLAPDSSGGTGWSSQRETAVGDGICVFTGTWAELPFAEEVAAFGGRIDTEGNALLDSASRQWPGRFLGFGGSGCVLSRGFENVAGDRYVVVCAGAVSRANKLETCGPAYTLRIGLLGDVVLEEGVPGRATGVEALSREAPSLLAAVRRRGAPRSNSPPVVDPLQVTPQPNLAFLPAGCAPNATFQVRQDGTLSLELSATDVDGDRLYCTWGGRVPAQPSGDAAPPPDPETEVDAGGGPGVGAFSVAETMPMEWDEARGKWTALVEWAPPASARVGSWISIGAVVDDLHGGRTGVWAVVQVLAPGLPRVAYTVTSRWGAGSPKLGETPWICDEAGAEREQLPSAWPRPPHREGDEDPDRGDFVHDLSPDGHYAIITAKGVPPSGRGLTFASRIVDLLSFSQESTTDSALGSMRMLADGAHVVCTANSVFGSNVYTRIRVSSYDLTTPARTLSDYAISWKEGPDGRLAILEPVDPGALHPICNLVVWDRAFSSRQVVAHDVSGFVWLPGGPPTRLLFQQQSHAYVASDAGAGSFSVEVASALAPSFSFESAALSPDGTWFAWLRRSSPTQLWYAPVDVDGMPGTPVHDTAWDDKLHGVYWMSGHRLGLERYNTGRSGSDPYFHVDVLDPATGILRRDVLPATAPRASAFAP